MSTALPTDVVLCRIGRLWCADCSLPGPSSSTSHQPVRPTVLRPAPLDLPRVPCSLGRRSDAGHGTAVYGTAATEERRDPFGRRHGRLWRGSFPTSPAAFHAHYRDGGKITAMQSDWATIEI